MNAADAAEVERWWRHFCGHGRLPEDLELVHGRLVRSVLRGQLPSGPVHVKAMAFPRLKDRLRYLLRPLPGAHEAAMLRAVGAAGVPCPEVLAVRTARRCGLPFRSLLVLRSLPLATGGDEEPRQRLRDEAALVLRLLAAGIVHRDLHGGNFVRLADGRLAVLDLQSARVVAPRRAVSRAVRIAAAARMLRERPGLGDDEGLRVVQAAALLDAGDAEAVRCWLWRERQEWARARLLRCFAESTEFRRQWRWNGCEHWQRGAAPRGLWRPHPRACEVWLGQRLLQLESARPPVFAALRRRWWWLGGGASLYVPAACDDGRIDAELQAALAAAPRARRILAGGDAEGHEQRTT
jgi:hypothetical protein